MSKKSPANAIALQHQHTGGSSSNAGGALTYDSPTAAALGLSLNIPSLESVVTNTNVRGDEDEGRRRIDLILAMLKTRPGAISQEGVERLARMTALDFLPQDSADGGQTLSMAGSGVVIDVSRRCWTKRPTSS